MDVVPVQHSKLEEEYTEREIKNYGGNTKITHRNNIYREPLKQSSHKHDKKKLK
jgi:hypothetical protein